MTLPIRRRRPRADTSNGSLLTRADWTRPRI